MRPTNGARRWARLRPGNDQNYPDSFRRQWLRVVELANPDVPNMLSYVWLDVGGKAQQVEAKHFEIVQRAKQRILVVDDDPGIGQTLQIALSKAGYDVVQARDGEEATRLWREWGPDLVITDIHMPKKSGLILMEELQANGSSARVIAMTDGGPARQLDLLGLSKLLGAMRTIAKPFTLDQMLNLVTEELSKT